MSPTTIDLTSLDGSEPLRVEYLYDVRNNEENPTEPGSYKVLHRLVTSHPSLASDGNSSIETRIEAFLEKDCESSRWMRVVVKSGPDVTPSCVHASFRLPATATPPKSNVLTWASFADATTNPRHHHHHHQLICVLANPTLVCIYDVYVNSDSSLLTGGEGWNISLPFDCMGIFGSCDGLLLQRSPNNDGSDDDFDRMETEFVLKAPPRLPRASIEMPSWPAVAASSGMTHPPKAPALFYLSHLLQAVVPVGLLGTPPPPTTGGGSSLPMRQSWSNVHEQVIWVGTPTWIETMEHGNVERSALVAVTYHTVQRRHAVWLVQEAPPSKASPMPLYQWTEQQLEKAHPTSSSSARSSSHAPDDWDLVVMDWNNAATVSELEVAATTTTAALPRASLTTTTSTTRQEALADALGVAVARKTTPRPSLEPVMARTRRSGRPFIMDSIINNNNNNVAHPASSSSLLSPMNRSVQHSAPMHESMTAAHSALPQSTLAGGSHLVGGGPFDDIHSTIAFKCIYEQDAAVPSVAQQVFLASNLSASGTLVLCLHGKGFSGSELRMYEMRPQQMPKNEGSLVKSLLDPRWNMIVHPLATIPRCTAALPIQSTPVPANYRLLSCQSGLDMMATDILVTMTSLKSYILRADRPMVSCSLDPLAPITPATTLTDAVGNRITWRQSVDWAVRGKLTLTLPSRLAERALSICEAALVANEGAPLLMNAALQLRVDVVRLAQLLEEDGTNVHDLGWTAFTTVFESIMGLGSMGATCSTDAWDDLVMGEYHAVYSLQNDAILPFEKATSTVPSEFSHFLKRLQSPLFVASRVSELRLDAIMFDSLHLFFEDCKLHGRSRKTDLPQLASLLTRVCRMELVASPKNKTAAALYIEHYSADLPQAEPPTEVQPFSASASRQRGLFSYFSSPPNVFVHLGRAMKGLDCEGVFSSITDFNAGCVRTKAILRIFAALLRKDELSRDLQVVKCILMENFLSAQDVLEELPTGIALPLLDLLYRCRCMPEFVDLPGWTADAWSLVGREDLCENLLGRPEFESYSTSMPKRESQDAELEDTELEANRDKDGLDQLQEEAAMLFPKDNRIREAARLLRSSRPIFLRVPRAIEVSDHEYEKLKQARLQLLARRTLALPIGRGMITFGNLRPLAAEPLPVTELCLKGRVPPANNTVALDISEAPPDVKAWPEFHNGVAAGLRLPASDESDSPITRTWIVYNRPPPQVAEEAGAETTPQPNVKSHSHGGVLLALGLRGHLTVLEMSDIYEYLTQGSATTTVGILLGMAANKRGSCDMSVSKMICLHIPSLIPQHFSAVDVASSVQTAAVAAAGLLFLKSSHRMMTEFLLNEIGKRPDSDISAFDREAYTLSCGLALGMVNLSLAGGENDSNRAAGVADLRLEERLIKYVQGGVDEDERRRTREASDRFSLPSASSENDTEKCSIIYEGDAINTDLTAPGATLALGLMYLKSGNETVAAALALPATHFLLEFVRPDFLAFRIVARALIMWNEVDATLEWIDQQIPNVVLTAYKEMEAAAKRNAEGRTASITRRRRDTEYDRRAVRQIYTHCVAGACFAMGLRFAGTGNESVKRVLTTIILRLRGLRDGSSAVSIAMRPEFPVLETCLGQAVISLAMVLAGTGDLEALSLFKILRWRDDQDILFGTHMVYGMAIGLLFLGGGTCTLGREPEDIAAIVAAFFPRYPVLSTGDNQYHLQALRHLYALAVKKRELRAVDVDTGESVYVAVKLFIANGKASERMTVPCLLRNSDERFEELRVISDEYYPLKINLEATSASYTFFVKKRGALLDADIFQSLLSGKPFADRLWHVTSNPLVLAFGKYLFKAFNVGLIAQSRHFSSLPTRILLESLSKDVFEVIVVYSMLQQFVDASAVGDAWARRNLTLVQTYFEERHRFVNDSAPSLFNKELIAHLIELSAPS